MTTNPENHDVPTTTTTDEPEETCTACGHPQAAHDAIAARFCTATTASYFARGCVCTSTSPAGNAAVTTHR